MAGGLCNNITNSNHYHFHFAPGFDTPVLAHLLDSLVRVTRRGKENHFVCKLSQMSCTATSHQLWRRPSTTTNQGRQIIKPQRPNRKRQGKYDKTNQHWFPSLPFQQFQVLFNSLFTVLCISPALYLYAIGLPPIFSFRWNLPPN